MTSSRSCAPLTTPVCTSMTRSAVLGRSLRVVMISSRSFRLGRVYGGRRVKRERVDARVKVRDLGPDLWIWRVLHPAWTAEDDWQPVVTCTCVDLGRERLLLDPLMPPPEASAVWDRLDARPPTAVVVLIPDHVRPTWHEPVDYQAAKRA